MTARAQLVNMVELVPERDIAILLEVVRRFLPDIDDVATEDDIQAHRAAMQEYAAGQTISHEDIDWD